MIENTKNFDDNSILPFFIHPQSDPARGQVHFCHNLMVNLFEKGNSPCKQEFPQIRKKRQNLDHYLKSICNTRSYYGIITIESLSSQPNDPTHQIPADDIDIEFSKVFTDYIKNIQHQNSKSKINIHE